jgi:outer membrane protein OmpA-like peptidoglycan-associated protein
MRDFEEEGEGMTTNVKQFDTLSEPEAEPRRRHTTASQPRDTLHTRSDLFIPQQTAGNLAIQRSMKQRLRVYPKLKVNQSNNPHEQEADRVAEKIARTDDSSKVDVVQSKSSSQTTTTSSFFGNMIDHSLRGTRVHGRALPLSIRESMEDKFGADFSDVLLHTDAKAHQMSNSFGANALTQGKDIYFNEGRYDPTSQEGNRLIAHELAHVVQQGDAASRHVQFDLMETLPTALGYFEIEMVTHSAPVAAPNNPGMEGHMRFFPDPHGPYSAQIGLIQVANLTDIGGVTTPASGAPIDWSHVGAGQESGRQDLMTTGIGGSPPGWYVDSLTAAHARGTSIGPNYIEQTGIGPDNYFGWLRSPTDWHEASLYDYPSSSVDVDFEFETAAKATDTQTIYGSLHWGFGTRSGVVQNEHVKAFDAESAIFNEALERFRGYYTHEPIVIYFDTNSDVPIAGEEAKILGVLDYFNRYPDVQIQLAGYADERGSAGHNADLSLRRALNVQNLAVSLGFDPSRFDTPIGMGETTSFATGSDPGTLRANRRVVMSFERTAITPIVMP